MKNASLIIIHIIILYAFSLLGTWIKDLFNLSVPGSVVGLLLLFILLISNIIKLEWIELGSRFLISNLVFFFIPATVGVMNYFDLFKGKGILLVVVVLISTILVMASSGLVSQFLAKDKVGAKK